MPSPSSSLTLQRGLRVLRVLAEHPEGMTVSELADALGTHRAGIYRLLGAHLSERLVWRRDDRYYLGAGLVELASRVRPRLQEVAGPLLQALADELTATTALTVRDGEDAAVVLDVRSRATPTCTSPTGPACAIRSRLPRQASRSSPAVLRGRPSALRWRWRASAGGRSPRVSCCRAPRGSRRRCPLRRRAAASADAAVSAVWIGDRDDAAMGRAVIASARGLSDVL